MTAPKMYLECESPVRTIERGDRDETVTDLLNTSTGNAALRPCIKEPCTPPRATSMAARTAALRWRHAATGALLQGWAQRHPLLARALAAQPPNLAASQARPANDGQQGRRRRFPWWLTVIACLVAFLVAQGNPWNSQSQPASVEQWNETRVVDWLQGLGLSRTQFKEIASQFLEADVDGDELLEIDTIEELEALGISARDTRLSRKLLGDKVLFEIAKLRARVSQRPHNFWEWRAAHPFKGNALYLGARFFPRCTAAYLVIFEPQLLEQLGIGWSSAGLGDSLLGGLAIVLLPYVSLFYYAWRFREIHMYMTLLAAYRALFGTCAELVWLQGRLRVLLNITAWQPPLRRGVNILRGLAYEAMRLTFFFQDVSILVVHTFFFFTFSQWIYGVLFFFQHCVQPLLEVGAVLAIHLVIGLNEDIARAVQDGTLLFLLRFQDAIRDAVRNAGPRVPDRAPAPPVHWPAPLQIPPGCVERHDVPNEFKCPITMSIMRVPASTPTGETFDYEELGKWILMRGTYPTNPSAKLSVTELHPNLYLRSEIEKWFEARGVNVS